MIPLLVSLLFMAPKPTHPIELVAASGSAMQADSVTVAYSKDGDKPQRIIRIALTVSPEPGEFSGVYEYAVNTETGQYTLAPHQAFGRHGKEPDVYLAPPELELLRQMSADERASRIDEPPMDLGEPPPPDGCPCMGAECDGWIGSWERTVNPLVIVDGGPEELTRTTAHGTWRRWVNNLQRCAWSWTAYNTCQAANPSHFNTHWFNSQCDPPHASGQDGYFTSSAMGNYYNWDFLQPNVATYVHQGVTQTLHDSNEFTFVITHVDSGEFSVILIGLFGYVGGNSCYPIGGN